MPRPKKKDARASVIVDTGTIQQLALASLKVAPENARKIDVTGLDELAADIAAHGLLQPLIGYADGDSAFICAGQRRLKALGILKKQGATVDLVPVRIVDHTTALEVSLAENLQRVEMNPADEMLAFKGLVDTGHHDAETIAARFGLDARHVRRRLKIAVLHPEILEQLRTRKISVSAAEAYAATSLHDEQLRIFKKIEKTGYGLAKHNASAILAEIRGLGISLKSPTALFIGGETRYLEAGGEFDVDDAFQDLFKAETYTKTERDKRMVSLDVVHKLVDIAKGAAQSKAEKLAMKTYPFTCGIRWAKDLEAGNPPKPDKGCEKIGSAQTYEAKPEATQAIANKCADVGGVVYAVAYLGPKGGVQISDRFFIVGKDALAEVRRNTPKAESGGSYTPMTPEERAAAEREREVSAWAQRLYGRSLIGKTEGFGVTRCFADWTGRVTIELVSEEATSKEAFEAMVAVFREEAEAKADATIAEKAARLAAEAAAQEAAANARAEAHDAFAEAFEQLDEEVVIFTVKDGDDPDSTIYVERKGGAWLVQPASEGEESIEDFSIVLDVIKDYADCYDAPVLTTYADVESYEAQFILPEDLDPDRLREDQIERQQLEAADA